MRNHFVFAIKKRGNGNRLYSITLRENKTSITVKIYNFIFQNLKIFTIPVYKK